MEQLITEEIDSYVLNLVEREEGQESIAGDAIQIAPVFNGEVEELLNGQNGFAWWLHCLNMRIWNWLRL